ncbi:MAG: Spx/MgsR family RNA polymerase-binding regulatory protein [Verrucomicrobiota bacterium]
MKVYTYKGCDGCRKATKWLKAQGFKFEELPIRETPPSAAELHQMLDAYDGELKRLFNIAGGDYREMKMKDRMPTLSVEEAFELLQANGNLVKRPFLLAESCSLVGFKETDWERALLQ